jgi:5-methylcytosine-specific restriction endonuclease McrA
VQLDNVIREKVESTPRKRLTKAQKAELLARQNDLCGECGVSLVWRVEGGHKVYGPMIDEHVLRLFLGGSNHMENRQIWCISCSKEKTRREATENAKVRRMIAKADPETRKPSRMQSKGFRKHPTLKRTLRGKVVPR